MASTKRDVDPIGACVGLRGTRIQVISRELRGEKIDIVEWSPDPPAFVARALSPAKVSSVTLSEPEAEGEQGSVLVIVPDNQLSLAIGKRGQNARLAAKLTGLRVDIKSEGEIEEERRREEEERAAGPGGARRASRRGRRSWWSASPRPASTRLRASCAPGSKRWRRCPASARRRRRPSSRRRSSGSRSTRCYRSRTRTSRGGARGRARPRGYGGGGRAQGPDGVKRAAPRRTCLGCRQVRPQAEMIRLTRGADGRGESTGVRRRQGAGCTRAPRSSA